MIDPRMPTDPMEPPYADKGFAAILLAEIRDHLWPWSRDGFRAQAAIQAAGIALAIAATLMWVYAATGRAAPGMVIGAWFGWSVFEVIVRLGSKPYVKEGPWWGRNYRRATLMDMICYVGFKNLLLGAMLFIALRGQNLLAT